MAGVSGSDADDILARVDELSNTVANLTGLDLMSEVLDALKDADVNDAPIEEPDLDSMYGGDEPSVLDVIASANTQSSYSLGKVEEDEGTGDWWEYVTQLGACEQCAPLDGTQAPQDDGIWSDRIPPLHPNCVCELKAIPAQNIRATEHDVPSEARGRSGWGNPLNKFDPDLNEKPHELLPIYHEKLRRNE